MNLKPFFVTALGSALELGIATSDDIMRHVTPDVLAAHLPRSLWAQVLAASLLAPRVDTKLVVDTITIPNLVEHVPATILWACLAEVGTRSIATNFVATPAATGGAATKVPPPPGSTLVKGPTPVPLSVAPPPEIVPQPVTATQPSPTVQPEIPEPEAEERPTATAASLASRTRTATNQRGFRPSSTNIGRLASTNPPSVSTTAPTGRRPQASAQATPPPQVIDENNPPTDRPVKRSTTASDFDVNVDDWKSALAVEDEQLVDWSSSEETVTGTSGTGAHPVDDTSSRKR